MRGGARTNAGRPGDHKKVEHHRRIDIRELARRGLLITGRSFLCEWGRDNTGSIGVSIYIDGPHAITLFYRWRREKEDWHSEQVTIRVEHTACHFGGIRPWFICPDCGRRSAMLYASDGRWTCRKTLNLAYQCQSEDGWGRMARQIWKAENRLGPNFKKPKSMHYATYERFYARWVNLHFGYYEKLDDEMEKRRDNSISCF